MPAYEESLEEECGGSDDKTNHKDKSFGNSHDLVTVRIALRAARGTASVSWSGGAGRTHAGRRRQRAAGALEQSGGRAGRQGVHARGRGSRHRTAVAGDRAGTPRNLVAVRLSGLRRRGALSILISNGEPSRPEFLRRGGGGELVEIDGRVGRDLRAREYKLCFLGGVDCGDKHEGNHGNVVPSLELNLHILPLSSGVGTPLYRAVSSLLVGITRTRDSGCGVGPDQ